MDQIRNFYKNKRVFISGHTGFKGIWLTSILLNFGAKIIGLSLNDNKKKLFYEYVKYKKVKSYFGNIENYNFIKKILNKNKPEIIFHLAAQSLVIDGYKFPLKTFRTNILGTLNLLEIGKNIPKLKSIIIVTSDKCYKNYNKLKFYKETDSLGGVDPYSSSKAAVEIVSDSYLKSFFSKSKIGLATARAGNVIGGGDWSKNRIIPDCIRSIKTSSKLILRNPNHIRPWQHVLEPLHGYLLLAMKLYHNPRKFSGAWNFGPLHKEIKSVKSIVNLIFEKSKKNIKILISKKNNYETYSIQLNSSKSRKRLNWNPKYNFKDSINLTHEWYNQYLKNKISIIPEQISSYYKKHK
jgi:CDP-glucose 4,6-dehydratase